MLPATAPVPLRLTLTVRSVSLVLASLASAPVTGATSSLTELIVAAFGATVSTVTLKAAVGVPTLPAVSRTAAVRLCAPSPSAAVVKLQSPCPLAVVVVPSRVEPSNIPIV